MFLLVIISRYTYISDSKQGDGIWRIDRLTNNMKFCSFSDFSPASTFSLEIKCK